MSMGTPDNKLSELVGMVKSWIPRRTEPPNVSRDFWMPDQSCRVCYECDSQFTIFNRKHHCRLCGRVFCAKCTSNSIPLPSDDAREVREAQEKIRVCNYCFKQWEKGLSILDSGTHDPTPGLSESPSAASLASSKSSSTYLSSSSTIASFSNSPRGNQQVAHNSGHSSYKSASMDPVMEPESPSPESKGNFSEDATDSPSNHCHFCFNRSDEDEDDCSAYPSDTDARHYSHVNDYYDEVNVHDIHHIYGPQEFNAEGDNTETKTESCSLSPQNYDTKGVDDEINEIGKDAEDRDQGDGCEISTFEVQSEKLEPVDFENNGLLWLPPEPEDEEDEEDGGLFDNEDDGATGDWGSPCTSNSFGSGEFRKKDKSCEEHRKAMKNVVEGHFRALVSQLLQVENLPFSDENDKESWLEIITSLSWEAATLLKPDTSKSAGMDPGGYVKVKCIACGRRRESMVVKGVVCKKNVAHRTMKSRIEKPRFLMLGGALEYQRVYNTLSSVHTLLQQEMDHLKMAVAKIDAHHPNLLLVEKSVSRYAQEYLLAKDISLVLNIKRTLLERIARCTGAQVVPSIDHLTSKKLGYCDIFHVQRFFEEHGSAGQGGKKLMKTLMFFEGCPKRLGCTILLKGAHGDELKKVKHVIQYAIFAAYHLGLETSFLADEGASLPELPLTSPITVALPNTASHIDRSIYTVPGFSVPICGESPVEGLKPHRTSSMPIDFMSNLLVSDSISNSELPCSEKKTTPGQYMTYTTSNNFSPAITFEENDKTAPVDSLQVKRDENRKRAVEDKFVSDPSHASEHLEQSVFDNTVSGALATSHTGIPKPLSEQGIGGEGTGSKEEFPPSPSDHQFILVFLSTRCVWNGTMCEPSQFLRIKYYGSFDKPLGRFLRDQLFDQNYCCHSCKKPSEAHVHCYTHCQGSLTISVKRLSENLLHGEREGKIWMWHRCLKCPRENGFPPATLRVVMSDAAWGLSFGKFLELSFSNHASASRVASCGHSLHRDCLRFYGFGRMVACFRYASINLNSVYLPPAKLKFSYDKQEWLKKEVVEVRNLTDSFFNEVHNALNHISAKLSDEGVQRSIKATDFMYPIEELDRTLQKEKEEFEELLRKAVCRESKAGYPAIDVLELNKLRRMIMFHSYVWDQRLIHASNIIRSLLGDLKTSSSTLTRHISSSDKLSEVNVSLRSGKGYNSYDSFLFEEKKEESLDGEVGLTDEVHQGQDTNGESLNETMELSVISGPNMSNIYEPWKGAMTVRRALSEGEYPTNLSDTLDAAWTGESHPSNIALKENGFCPPEPITPVPSASPFLASSKSVSEYFLTDRCGSAELPSTSSSTLGLDSKWTGVPFSDFYSSFNRIFPEIAPKFAEHIPVYMASMIELDQLSGAKLVLDPAVNDTVVPVYNDEPTSIVAHALVSVDYYAQISESERDSSISLPLLDPTNLLSFNSFDESISEAYRSLGSFDESFTSSSSSRNSQGVDPGYLHVRVNFMDDSPLGKVKYAVTCYYAKRFEALRRICCPSEIDFIRSISRCKKWGAQGGKSNVFFAKTLDDRFIIKQVTKTELESFIKFAPTYFKYISESISSGSPTCLAKILGIYQVSSKHLKGGKETKMDILVMENLLFDRNVTRLYDLKGSSVLKGSSRSRYNPDTSGSNTVLLDQNLIESMTTSPIFVGNKAKRFLVRAVWNDTAFLSSVNVMDYSLLVGVDEQKHELVLGIIDFMRQYTWDKHLETWVKTSGILGGPKNASPTVISPKQYKKRFRKAMTAYFLVVPEWSPPTSHPSPCGTQSEVSDQNSSGWKSIN